MAVEIPCMGICEMLASFHGRGTDCCLSEAVKKFGDNWCKMVCKIFPKPIRKSFRTRGPFLDCPGNFSGPKSSIQIEI